MWGLEFSVRLVGTSLKISHSTVEEKLKQATQPGLNWGLADAILDRLVHNAHRIELLGESQRKIRPQHIILET